MSKIVKKSKSVDVYILAGCEHSGKTTTIRHIVNKANNKDESYKSKQSTVDIEITINVNVTVKTNMLYKVGSMQEDEKSSQYLKTLVSKKKNVSAVLVPLRTEDVPPHKMPKAEEYIEDFVKFGWNIKCVVELDVKPNEDTKLKKYCDEKQYKYKSFEKCEDALRGELFGEIKKFFGFNV